MIKDVEAFILLNKKIIIVLTKLRSRFFIIVLKILK